MIEKIDVLADRGSRRMDVSPRLVWDAFSLEGTEEAFGDRIVPAVRATTHAGLNA